MDVLLDPSVEGRDLVQELLGGGGRTMKAVFEPELEGDSILVWEAGRGSRVIYFSPSMSESAYEWLLTVAARFHAEKERSGALSVEVFGEPMSPYEVVRRYLSVAKSAGLDVWEHCAERESSEFW